MSKDEIAMFLIGYKCERCDTYWHMENDCTCNDRCPECDLETEPGHWEDI